MSLNFPLDIKPAPVVFVGPCTGASVSGTCIIAQVLRHVTWIMSIYDRSSLSELRH